MLFRQGCTVKLEVERAIEIDKVIYNIGIIYGTSRHIRRKNYSIKNLSFCIFHQSIIHNFKRHFFCENY